MVTIFSAFPSTVPLGCTAVAQRDWDRSLHLCLTGEEAERGPHWPQASGSLGVRSSFYSFVLLRARAVPCASGSGCRSGLRCSRYLGCCLGGGPRVEEGCVCGGGSPRTLKASSAAPASGRKVSALGGSCTLHRLLGWEPRECGRGSLSFCSASWSRIS